MSKYLNTRFRSPETRSQETRLRAASISHLYQLSNFKSRDQKQGTQLPPLKIQIPCSPSSPTPSHLPRDHEQHSPGLKEQVFRVIGKLHELKQANITLRQQVKVLEERAETAEKLNGVLEQRLKDMDTCMKQAKERQQCKSNRSTLKVETCVSVEEVVCLKSDKDCQMKALEVQVHHSNSVNN